MKKYKIQFSGWKKIEAHTKGEAEAELLTEAEEEYHLSTKSLWLLVGEGILVNLGGLVTMFVAIMLVFAWRDMGIMIQGLEPGFKEVALLGWIVLLLVSVRFPNRIGNSISRFGR